MSEKVSITKSKLDSLANAIAAVGGTSIPKTLSQMESAVLELTVPPNLESIAVNTTCFSSQSTTIEDGWIGTQIFKELTDTITDDTEISYSTTRPNLKQCFFSSFTGNTHYKVYGQFELKWANNDTEIYTININDWNYNGSLGTYCDIPFTWSGSGRSQTFNRMKLLLSEGQYIGVYLYTSNSITDTVTWTSNNYLSFYTIGYDGYESITINLLDNPQFLPIYKSLAYRSVIASSALGVSEWGNSLSTIEMWQFCAQKFSGNFVFNNVSSVGQYAFAVAWTGNGTSIYSPSYTVNFLRSSGTSLGQYTFYNNGMIKEINGPYISIIPSGFCQSCISLTTVSFSECTTINTNAFISCRNLTTVSFPECITIGNNAFSACSNLTTASFPECTSIGAYAFQACNKLITVSFSKCTNIDSYAFRFCSSLATISFPKCTTINGSAFYGCTSLTTASFPECTSISNYAFQGCTNLTTISFPECTTIGNNAFSNCSNLTTVSFPKCTSIGSSIFSNCQKLESVYLMGSSIPTLGTGVFNSTPITVSTYLGYFGSIYVPSSLLASYKTATNWATYSNRMVGI